MSRHRQAKNHSNKTWIVCAVYVAALSLLFGVPDAVQWGSVFAADAKASQQSAAPVPTEAVKAPDPVSASYTYDPKGRRDPFMPLIIKEQQQKSKANLPPLERYDISEFKLSGIVWGGFGYNAILEGPDGKGYFIRQGSIIGPNRGVVKSITKTGVVVEEKYKTYTGQTQRKEIVMPLRKKQEGME